MTTNQANTQQAFELAGQRYESIGVDVQRALQRLRTVAISVHCWQGDDVVGFEGTGAELGSGLAVTGNYPGRARTANELRSDLELAYSLIPGTHRLNLHAMYGEFDGPVDRNEIGVEHFQGWIDWSAEQGIKPGFQSELLCPRKSGRRIHAGPFRFRHSQFWIDHGIASRKIAAAMGEAQGNPCVNNVWVPDGYKDSPASRKAPRERLAESLDAVFAESIDTEQDAGRRRVQVVRHR